MTDEPRRHRWRPYFFEWFTALNFAAIAIWVHAATGREWRDLASGFGPTLLTIAVNGAVGVVLRLVVLAFRRRTKPYLYAICRTSWIVDAVRVIFFIALTAVTYAWIKVQVPVLHPHLYDQQLWNLDRTIFFGLSPNIFFLSLFGTPATLRAVDLTYAYVFAGTMTLALLFSISSPSRRIRVAFVDATSAMWLTGAWLYMLVPSLGPAYRFPEVWIPLAALMPHTYRIQRMLMLNYMSVNQPNAVINIFLGVAAFPSLHVAWQTMMFFWTRKVRPAVSFVFAIFMFAIFFGSMITGWHYFIDALAGVLLAWVTYEIPKRLHHVDRMVHLFRVRRAAHALPVPSQ